jgi:putative transcription factor
MNQDWETIQWRKETKRQRASSAAGVINSQRTHAQATNVKLDEATTGGKIEKIPIAVSRALMQGRIARKLKQSELATQLSMPVKTIQDIESGKYKMDNRLFQKIARKLGVKL